MQNHCLQIEIDLVAFLDQLFNSEYKIFERKVEYKDDYHILHIHESLNKHHADYFSNFDFNRFLDLLALKRDAFQYENEIRFFATEQSTEERSSIKMKPLFADLTIEWKDIIKSIRVDKRCSDSELIALRYSCWARGINPVFKGRNLPGDENSSVSGLKPVDVFLFNIDDMPGRKSIVIEPVV